MRRLRSDKSQVGGTRVFRVLTTAALVASVPLAFAQRSGSSAGNNYAGQGYAGHSGGGSYGRSFAGYSAPNFVSTFGPHSITGAPGANFVMPSGHFAPNYGSSWGVSRPIWRGENANGSRSRGRDWDHDGDRDHDRDRSRNRGSGYGYPFLPVYSSPVLIPWDMGYSDVSGAAADYSQNSAAAAPEYSEPVQDEYRPPYGAPESDYAPPPPAAAPVTPVTELEPEPALTLIFRDGHQQSIRNYALTSDAVIVLDKAASGRQQRIPLADLNLPATEGAAQAAGLEFHPPE